MKGKFTDALHGYAEVEHPIEHATRIMATDTNQLKN